MYIQLGNIILEPLNSPLSHSETQDTQWAEHPLLNTKPRLQPTGQGLKELTMSLRLHALFCNIKDSWKALSDAQNNYTVLPLLWGNGEVGSNYVITEMSNTRESSFSDGTPESELVNITLKEYYVTPAQAARKETTEAQKNALAVNKAGATKTTVASKIVNQPTCNTFIAKQRQLLGSLSVRLDSDNKKRNALILSYSFNRDPLFEIVEVLKKEVYGIENIVTTLTNSPCLAGHGELVPLVQNINSSAKLLLEYYNSNKALDQFQIANGSVLVLTLNTYIYRFIQATQSMATDAMLRR